MAKLTFEKKEKRDAALTVRIRPSVVDMLNELKDRHQVSQADIVEKLIESAYQAEIKPNKEKK
jgi:hypothetical protein